MFLSVRSHIRSLSVPNPIKSTSWCHTGFFLQTFVQPHFTWCALWWNKSSAVCLTIENIHVNHLLIFSICWWFSEVLTSWMGLGLFHVLIIFSSMRCLNYASKFLLFPLGWFLPAWLSTGETQASCVVLKVELTPWLIDGLSFMPINSQLCNSLQENPLSCRWSDP